MAHGRSFRKKGDILLLGHTEYNIIDVAGFGGSSVVYKAVYEDKLNAGKWHQVLLKELYPFHPKGYIYRDDTGFIRWLPEAKELMECSRLHFRQGNQVNLELLERAPSQTSGNVNSYEAYGTYYSVLTVHGGRTLEEELEDGNPKTLQDSIELIIKILNALEHFHQNHMLHLDISPDNIILLPEQALLIDYNSVWVMEEGANSDFIYCEKEGYCAPEIRLQKFDQIGYATDLFSVCAVFYQMLAGARLTDEAIIGNPIKRLATEKPEILQGEPKSAVHKIIEILRKGLHILPRKRYQNVDGFRGALYEALERIYRKGVSHSAVWESSRSLCKNTCCLGEYLFRKVCLSTGEYADVDGIYRKLKDGMDMLLTGPGGMGKTRLLLELWKKGSKGYDPNSPIIYYIPLKDYQEMTDEGEYIRKYVVRHLCFSEKQNDMEAALHELERMFRVRLKAGCCIILLLDGLNEAGSRRGRLLKEIEYLGSMEGVSILVTERSNEVQEYGLALFKSATLLPLTEDVVTKRIKAAGFSVPAGHDMKELLCNPMMLDLYLQAAAIRRETFQDKLADTEFHDAKSLVGFYFEQLLISQMRIDSGDQAAQLCHRYILQHLLPEIAGKMKRNDRSLLTFDELYLVTKRNYENLHLLEFGKSFPQFLGKARFMLTGIADESQWFDFAVTEQLSGDLGLIVKGENGYFGLAHDNFQEYLVQQWEQNKTIYRKRKWKLWARKWVAFSAIGLLGIGGIFALYKTGKWPAFFRLTTQQRAYTQEEEKVIDRVVICMETNLAALSAQILVQEDILEQAGKTGILECDPKEMEDLRELMDQKITMVNTFPTLDLKPELIGGLVDIDPDIPVLEIQDLCNKATEMKAVMETALLQLDNMLCMEDSIYGNAQEREEIVDAYQNYLDAYTEHLFYQFDYILLYLEPDEIGDILNDTRYFPLFSDYFKTIGISQQDPATVKTAMEYGMDKVKEAQERMAREHYKIDWR